MVENPISALSMLATLKKELEDVQENYAKAQKEVEETINNIKESKAILICGEEEAETLVLLLGNEMKEWAGTIVIEAADHQTEGRLHELVREAIGDRPIEIHIAPGS